MNQVLPLLGEHGLLPVPRFLGELESSGLGRGSLLLRLPTVFWWGSSDALLLALARLGLVLSLLVLGGLANAPRLAALWLLYMSFVHGGLLHGDEGALGLLAADGPFRDHRPRFIRARL